MEQIKTTEQRDGPILYAIGARVFKGLTELKIDETNQKDLLSNKKLSGKILEYGDLKDANLSKLELNKFDFSNVNFGEANFDGSILRGCDLRGADLSNVKGLNNAQLNSKSSSLRILQGKKRESIVYSEYNSFLATKDIQFF